MKSFEDNRTDLARRARFLAGALSVGLTSSLVAFATASLWGPWVGLAMGFGGAVGLAVLIPWARTRRELAGNTERAEKDRQDARRWLDARLARESECGRLAVLAASVELSEDFLPDPNRTVPAEVLSKIEERFKVDLREDDLLVRGDVTDFLICLSRLRAPQSDTLNRLAHRLQDSAQHAVTIGSRRVHPRLTVGIASSRLVQDGRASDILSAAEDAHDDATAQGPGGLAIAGLTPASANADAALLSEVADALENGQITAWYQPQLSTETGDISGFEALARWEHPTRGIVSPASFLPLIERAGLSRRLAKVVLTHALSAIRTWDRAGLGIPGVGVNFSAEELRDPNLAEFLKWELDRFDLDPSRLVVEVLETVISESHEDAVAQNLRSLSTLGCRIDLDDFGTGFTSIINIRRFDVSRIKIDRKLVTGAATDAGQRDLIAALLSMSEHLHVDTLGEGVETQEEHLTLAQLGCGHVQGFAIARPMPLGDTLAWVLDHRARMASVKAVAVRPKAEQ